MSPNPPCGSFSNGIDIFFFFSMRIYFLCDAISCREAPVPEHFAVRGEEEFNGRCERIGAQRGRMEDAVDFTTSWEFIVVRDTVACDRSVALFQYFISWACRSALFSNIQTTGELMVREAVLKAGITLLTSLKVLSPWHVDMRSWNLRRF